MDVGGGSLELTLIRDGKRLRGKSFKIGTIRSLKGADFDGEWEAVEEFVKHVTKNEVKLVAIGTGGNINRLQRLIGNPKNTAISISKLEEITSKLKSMTYEERVRNLSLKPDRADVIILAADIYLKVMKLARCQEIIVPKVGLSDGIILQINEEYRAFKASKSQKKT